MTEFIIRKMRTEDIIRVQSLEEQVFNDPWTVQQFEYEIGENPISVQYVLEINSAIRGYIVFWVTFDSSTICKIAIDEAYRKEGLGSSLLETMFDELENLQVETSTLEVRVDNEAAITFYTKHGYSVVTVKAQYYHDGTDAYYMVRVLI